MFGENCQTSCHCEGSCNRFNGTCHGGICQAGYKGNKCQSGMFLKYLMPSLALIEILRYNNRYIFMVKWQQGISIIYNVLILKISMYR